MDLLVIGTMAFDSLETPYGKADRIVGGAATYISWAATHFTQEVNVVSVIGGDFPKSELKELEARGVNFEGLQIKEDEKSFFWHGRYHNDMNSRDTLATELNVLENFDPVLPNNFKKPAYVMLGNLTPSVQKKVIDSLSEKPKLIAMDTMNFWMDIAMDDLKETLKFVDLLTINDEEARQLSGEYSLVKAARKIREMGPKYLVIKKGEHGALLFHGDNTFYAPALPLEEVFDPTGAGDTFAGGYMGYLAMTNDLSFENMKRAVIYGSAMASFCVEKFGHARLKEVSKSDINIRINKFSELVAFDQDAVFAD